MSEWISVKDKLPPAGMHRVVMYDLKSTAMNPIFGWWDSTDHGGTFFAEYARATQIRIDPTHYILIPGKPNE